VGREAQKSPESTIYDAIITAAIFSFELSRGRYRGRYGILDVEAVSSDALRRRWDWYVHDSRIPKRNGFMEAGA
jgi:hypothetical protein